MLNTTQNTSTKDMTEAEVKSFQNEITKLRNTASVMLENKKIYVPHITITDKRYPKVDGEFQYVGATEAHNFNHQQALDWIDCATKTCASLFVSYRIDMRVCEKQMEEV